MIRPQQNDEPARKWRSLAAQNSNPGWRDTEPVMEDVGVVGGSMSGKGRGVNTGDPQGRRTNSRRAGVRAPMVVLKRVMTVERRECRKVRTDAGERSLQHRVSAHRAVPHEVMSSLCDEAFERRTQPKQNNKKLVPGLMTSRVRVLHVLSDGEGEQSSKSARSPTGEPDAGDPPVRFGGRNGTAQCAVPTSISLFSVSLGLSQFLHLEFQLFSSGFCFFGRSIVDFQKITINTLIFYIIVVLYLLLK